MQLIGVAVARVALNECPAWCHEELSSWKCHHPGKRQTLALTTCDHLRVVFKRQILLFWPVITEGNK